VEIVGKVWGWIKEHPFIAGGIVLGLVVLIVLMRSGQSNTSAQSTGPGGMSAQDYAAEVGAATQLQAQQLQMQALTNQQNNALSASQDTNATQLAIATLAAQTQQNNNNVTAGVDTMQLSDQLAAVQAQIGGQVTITSLNDQLASNQTAAQQQVQDTALAVQNQAGLSNAATMNAQIAANAQIQNAAIVSNQQITQQNNLLNYGNMQQLIGAVTGSPGSTSRNAINSVLTGQG
jgi:hypothetical protein